MDFTELKSLIEQWAKERGILDAEDGLPQCIKLEEEVNELKHGIIIGDRKEIIDGIGDCLVVLINLAKVENIKLEDALEYAYNQIKNRKGKMVNGIFVKEAKK